MLKIIRNFNKKDYGIVLLCILFVIFEVWLDLKIPDYMSKITTLVQTSGSQIKDVLVQGSYMLLCAFGSLLGAIIVGYMASLLSASFSKNLRKKIFDKVESFSMEEIKKFKTSSLITRTTNDITNIQMLISIGLQMLIKAPITAVWAICKILNRGLEWSIVTGAAVLILLITIGILVVVVLPKFKIVQKLIDNINGLTRENLTGVRVIRAFNAEKFQENKFEKGNQKLTKTQMFNQRMMGILSPMMYLIMNLLALSIYFIGAYLINDAAMPEKITLFSNMVVFTSYAMQVIMSFLMLAMIFIMYPRAAVSAERINEVLDTKTNIEDGNFTGDTSIKGLVEFKKVSFKYPDSDEYVLKDISFTAQKGQTIAFIGSTGSGKSTLINLIPRFYDATSGEILIDGINVKEYNLENLYNKLGYIAQKPIMFKGNVDYNVSYGKSAKKITKDNIKKALDIAQATSFVEEMDESEIARGGTNISGGQKQRIAIARAIARNPEIYIFDDSFSALDYKTDYILRKELKRNIKDATCLIVAQRIGTIKNADQILVIDNCKCVGMGKHKELLKKCKVYKEIAYSQLSKEELANE